MTKSVLGANAHYDDRSGDEYAFCPVCHRAFRCGEIVVIDPYGAPDWVCLDCAHNACREPLTGGELLRRAMGEAQELNT